MTVLYVLCVDSAHQSVFADFRDVKIGHQTAQNSPVRRHDISEVHASD